LIDDLLKQVEHSTTYWTAAFGEQC